MTPKTTLLFSGLLLMCAGLVGAAQAEPAKKKPHHAEPRPATSPARATDLNSPSTDFSGVSPVMGDQQEEMMRRKRDKHLDLD